MKKKFEIGDRVAVYGRYDVDVTPVSRFTGTVSKVDESGEIGVQDDGGHFKALYCHPKQCRRLVKKARRRVFIIDDDIGDENIGNRSITFNLHAPVNECWT